MNTLLNKLENNIIDYDTIKKDNIFIIQEQKELFDINFLITARGRFKFSEPMYKSFKAAKENSDLKITYTLIEHSNTPEHSKFCKNNKINYIWVSSNKKQFNKCMCYNLGVLFGQKSKYYLFHDIDILVQSDFFVKLKQNIINNNKCKALQCFTNRRVLYCNENITKDILENKVHPDDLSLENDNVSLPMLGGKVMLGAPGGSILVERDLFFKVGGYDPEFFVGYSPEDAFFWDKLSLYSNIYLSNNPEIEIFHMYHPPSYHNSPNLREREFLYEDFKKLSKKDKEELINKKRKLIEKYKNYGNKKK